MKPPRRFKPLIAQVTYSEKLRDPRWQKKRLEVMKYAEFRRQACGSKTRTLNVHHSYYVRGKDPWQYPKGSLCEECHAKLHRKSFAQDSPMPRESALTRFEQMKALLAR